MYKKNTKAQLEMYKQTLATLLNDKSTIEWQIKKEQKFVTENSAHLGANSLKLFLEHIERLQNDLSYTEKRINFTKSRIEFYEYKAKFTNS
jgi:hypothetical protein